jgi:hypothetical protein
VTAAPPRTPEGKCLGRIQARSDPRTLMLRAFAPVLNKPPPAATRFWNRRAGFTDETWGNDQYGSCTVSKQCNMFRRFERLERKRTITIAGGEAVRVYLAMTQALYGGGDTGAYEEDALGRSRSPDTCLHDTDGHPLLIDAYVRVDAKDLDAVRWAVAMAAGHGVAICFNLPVAWSRVESPAPWDAPEGQPLTGDWEPGSWGGHSMWAIDYTRDGLIVEHTWGIPEQIVTWRGVAAFMDEAHVVIDSVDAWRKKPIVKSGGLDLAGIVKAVNRVSRVKIVS